MTHTSNNCFLTTWTSKMFSLFIATIGKAASICHHSEGKKQWEIMCRKGINSFPSWGESEIIEHREIVGLRCIRLSY